VQSLLLRNILHLLLSEIRLPITDLLSHLKLMQARAEAGDYAELSRMSAFALRHSERLLSVMDMLLDVLLNGAIRLVTSRGTLQSVVEQACQAMAVRAAEQRINLHNRVPADLPHSVLDERLFTQALVSLLEVLFSANAAEGDLYFTAEYDEGSSQFWLKLHDARLNTNSTALERGFQTPLSALLDQQDNLQAILSRVIMRAHGAAVQLSATPEGGVQFEIRLPLMPAEPSVKRVSAAPIFNDQFAETLGDSR
jgi:K+-sensing histidine kinase KdpD